MTEKAIKDMSFEEAMQELEAIVKQLEAGEMDLEKSIKSYERGTELKKHCDSKLKQASMKIEKVVIGENQNPQTVEANFDD
jgi:exodeoxyribonuclease VII small subunit